MMSRAESPTVDSSADRPADPKWSDDAFLDRLRASTDDEANRIVDELAARGGAVVAANRLLRGLRSMNAPLPPTAPPVLRAYFERHRRAAGRHQLRHEDHVRGGQIFFRWAFPAALVMLASSLPSGYSAPPLSGVLTISDDLAAHPYHRLLAVIQLLINVSSETHDDHPDAAASALQLRLLHAGVRRLVPEHRPGYAATYGPPVNHEDMLATIMGFSLLVIDGVRDLGLELSPADAEAYWRLWRHFSRLMAIVPDGDFDSHEFLPRTLDDARAFYRSYRRRWFCEDPRRNPDGVRLTERNRQMMIDLVPWTLRLVGLGRAPDILMTELLGARGLARVGLQPVVGHHLDRRLLHAVLRFGQDVTGVGEDFTSLFAARILGGMVHKGMGRVIFSVPDSIDALRRLAEPRRAGAGGALT